MIASDSMYWGRPEETGLWIAKVDFLPGTILWETKSKLITKIIKTDSTNIKLCYSPKWSPNGKKIIFVMGNKTQTNLESKAIFSINSDGNKLTKLTDDLKDIKHLTWHPNGKKIAFIANKDNKDKIYIMNDDGKNIKRLSRDNINQEYHPFWLELIRKNKGENRRSYLGAPRSDPNPDSLHSLLLCTIAEWRNWNNRLSYSVCLLKILKILQRSSVYCKDG